jgi:hypothetical protein
MKYKILIGVAIIAVLSLFLSEMMSRRCTMRSKIRYLPFDLTRREVV